MMQLTHIYVKLMAAVKHKSCTTKNTNILHEVDEESAGERPAPFITPAVPTPPYPPAGPSPLTVSSVVMGRRGSSLGGSHTGRGCDSRTRLWGVDENVAARTIFRRTMRRMWRERRSYEVITRGGQSVNLGSLHNSGNCSGLHKPACCGRNKLSSV